MPVNVTNPEYFKAQDRYASAKTPQEKLQALEDMLKHAPTHKGAEKVRADLKSKISKLKKEVGVASSKTASYQSTVIKKEGDVQVCMIGFTNSGKSTILNTLTGSYARIADYMYTTKEPEVGVFPFGGALVQMVEIPATFEPQFTSLIHITDGVLMVIDGTKNIDEQRKKLLEYVRGKPYVEIITKTQDVDMEILKKNIWDSLGKIRVYTKGHEGERPVVLDVKATIKEFAEQIHKDLIKNFRFARIWGPSAKFPGETVGIEHNLKDGDVVEIFA